MGAAVEDLGWRAMGTSCHVLLHVDGAGADPCAMVVGLVADLEARWSRFRPESELCRINDRAGSPVTVSDETLFAVGEALHARERTAGRFDPTILPALQGAGYDRDFAEVAARAAGATIGVGPAHPAGAEVVVDVDAGTVQVERGAALDLGGIGKGLAADIAATTVLGAPGVLGACVNLGGDLRAAGVAPSDAGWGVVIADPIDPEATVATVAFADGGLATSSTRRRRWRAGGSEQHHVIDPNLGRPAGDDLWSVTVLARTGAAAEVLATAALVAGPDAGARLLDEAQVAALLVGVDGRCTVGPMAAYLR